MLGDLRGVPVVLAVAVGVLGLLVATHAMLLAVRRRSGDLAVLRAIGLRPVDIRRVVTWQAIAMGAVAVAVGVPAGLILGRVAWTAVATPANVLVRLDLEPVVVAGVALLTVVLLVAAAIWPGRRAARLGLGDAEVRVMSGAVLWACVGDPRRLALADRRRRAGRARRRQRPGAAVGRRREPGRRPTASPRPDLAEIVVFIGERRRTGSSTRSPPIHGSSGSA